MVRKARFTAKQFAAAYHAVDGDVEILVKQLGLSKPYIWQLVQKHIPASKRKRDKKKKENELETLIKKYKTSGSKQLRDQIVVKCTNFIRYIMHKMAVTQSVWDDVFQECSIRVLHAIDLFDRRRHTKFKTFVGQHIRGAILDYFRGNDTIPRSERKREKRWKEIVILLTGLLKRAPNLEEVEAYGGMIRPDIKGYTSLQGMVDLFGHVGKSDIIVDRSMDYTRLRNRFEDLVSSLNIEDQTILFLYYFKDVTMKQIGALYGLSESRISQLHSSLLLRLQTYFLTRDNAA